MDETDVATKTETAYRTLRQEILETRLRPGAPLKLGAMREAYGIGWTPLREALSRLEAERLVTSSANKGYAVAPVSLEELSDLTRARRLVELPMLAESIANGDEAWETAGGVVRTVWEERGLWFRTPEAYDRNGNYRASLYLRPLAIWAIEEARRRASRSAG